MANTPTPTQGKIPPTASTMGRATAVGGATFLGPTILYPILDYVAQWAHLNPQPDTTVLVAAASLVSGFMTGCLAFFIRGRAGLEQVIDGGNQ